ncbi:hypothetical protein BH23VER1_BH23VER1_00910 [soil metagenome]
MFELLLNAETYERVLKEAIPAAEKFVWIATADLKDLHVAGARRKFVPFVGVLAELVARGVGVRLIHAKEPGPRFRRDFDLYPELVDSDHFERILCPRMHMKVIIVDGRQAYIGSANLTGAGIGAKGEHRRNFEAGLLTDDTTTIRRLMESLDALYLGQFCIKCQRRDVCPDPLA